MIDARPKNIFEAILKYGHDEDFEPELPDNFLATSAPAGSAEKIAVLSERLMRGEPLWHDYDRVDYSGLTGAIRPRADTTPVFAFALASERLPKRDSSPKTNIEKESPQPENSTEEEIKLDSELLAKNTDSELMREYLRVEAENALRELQAKEDAEGENSSPKVRKPKTEDNAETSLGSAENQAPQQAANRPADQETGLENQDFSVALQKMAQSSQPEELLEDKANEKVAIPETTEKAEAPTLVKQSTIPPKIPTNQVQKDYNRKLPGNFASAQPERKPRPTRSNFSSRDLHDERALNTTTGYSRSDYSTSRSSIATTAISTEQQPQLDEGYITNLMARLKAEGKLL